MAEMGAKTAAEIYYLIKFNANKDKNDSEYVFVSVNGEQIQCNRQKVVPVTGLFIEALRHAAEPLYKEQPDGLSSGKVLAGDAERYPFEIVARNIPKADFDGLKKAAKTGEILTDKVTSIKTNVSGLDSYPWERPYTEELKAQGYIE